MILLIFAIVFILWSIKELGFLSVLCYLAATIATIALNYSIQSKASKSESDLIKAFGGFLNILIKIVAAILLIIGVISFISGLFGSPSKLVYTGEPCSACGGTGYFFSKVCGACKGSGGEFHRKTAWGGTWSGFMLTVSSAIVFLSTFADFYDNLVKKKNTPTSKKDPAIIEKTEEKGTPWFCKKCNTKNHPHVKTCQGCGLSKKWLESNGLISNYASSNSTDQKESDEETWTCLKCNTENRIHVKTCQGCGLSWQWLASNGLVSNSIPSNSAEVLSSNADTISSPEQKATVDTNDSRNNSNENTTFTKPKAVLIGKVVEGLYSGAKVYKLLEKNILCIRTEEGNKIAISQKNVISIDDVTEQYSFYGKKVLMVLWNDFETSLLLIGST